MVAIVKRKATGFFKPNDLLVIKKAVLENNEVIRSASMLARAYYLLQIDNKVAKPVLDDKVLGLAIRAVQGSPTCGVRESKKQTTDIKKKKKLEDDEWKRAAYPEMVTLCNKLFGSNIIKTSTSISGSFDYAIANLITAYENNIKGHFPKYLKKLIKCDMLLNTKQDLKTVSKNAAILTNWLLYDIEENGKIIDSSIELLPYKTKYNYMLPQKGDKPYCYDLVANPMAFLPSMVHINRMLEHDYLALDEKVRKLYNPIPFHSSNVPIHMRLDTSGIAQLLMNKKRIEEFKNLYELEHFGTTLNMTSKEDMLSSYEKIFGQKASDKREEAEYATYLWSFLTNLATCKQRKELYCKIKQEDYVFDNAIITDGYSISFQTTKLSEFQRKEYGKNNKNKKKIIETNPEDKKKKKKVNTNDSNTVTNINISTETKILAIDPGKSDILTVTDGLKTITYTCGKRKQDTFAKSKAVITLRKRRKSGLEEYETTVLNMFPKKSCTLNVFVKYCFKKEERKEIFTNVYTHPYFRQSKFTTYCKSKSSEHKFVDKIIKTYQKTNQSTLPCTSNVMAANAAIEVIGQPKPMIEIAWGNWGKQPNALKNGAPTPGIGIKKRFEGFFKVHTICEHMTSQTCPCCKCQKTLKKPEINNITRHHLLRCTNDCSSSWWNRNVVGSYNILVKSLAMTSRYEQNYPLIKPLGSGMKASPSNPRT